MPKTLLDPYGFLCKDLERAAQNRARIKSGYCSAYWDYIEAVIKSTPKGRKFPANVPVSDTVYPLPKTDSWWVGGE